MALTKYCTSCKRSKKIEMFGKRSASADGLMIRCKACVSKANAKYKAKNPEAQRTSHLKVKYNLTPEEYQRIDTLQEGNCSICGKHKSVFGMALAVDHNHDTGQLRGLLCINCNNGLGKFHDDIILLERAVQYLRSFENVVG